MKKVVKEMPEAAVAVSDINMNRIYAIKTEGGRVYVLEALDTYAKFASLTGNSVHLANGPDRYTLMNCVLGDSYDVFEFETEIELAKWILGESQEKPLPDKRFLDTFSYVGLVKSGKYSDHIIKEVFTVGGGFETVRVTTWCGIFDDFINSEDPHRPWAPDKWALSKEVQASHEGTCLSCNNNLKYKPAAEHVITVHHSNGQDIRFLALKITDGKWVIYR